MINTTSASALSTHDKVRLVAGWLQEKKAQNLTALDIGRICNVAEAMLVASVSSARQGQAVADHLLAMCAEHGVSFLGMDGYKTGQWILVDLNDVLVHIFLDDARTFYNLEGLWSEGEPIALPEPSSPNQP
ncbi:ribosome silencing factor [Fundidesulfovibrio butyratiphilus]